MDTQLNYASPIVQRVLHLRERMDQYEADARKPLRDLEIHSGVAAIDLEERSSEWQMWGKSDFSAYEENGTKHTCKSQIGARG